MCTHQADASDTALGDGALAHLRRLLPEEEIQLVVVPLGAVRDEVHVDEGGVCGGGRGGGKRIRQDDERLFQSSEDLHLWEHLAKTSFKNCQHFLFIAH